MSTIWFTESVKRTDATMERPEQEPPQSSEDAAAIDLTSMTVEKIAVKIRELETRACTVDEFQEDALAAAASQELDRLFAATKDLATNDPGKAAELAVEIINSPNPLDRFGFLEFIVELTRRDPTLGIEVWIETVCWNDDLDVREAGIERLATAVADQELPSGLLAALVRRLRLPLWDVPTPHRASSPE